MTTYEHVMLGVNGALATGLHHRYHWKIVALAGIAAALPDWDGLTWFISNEAFGQGHRVWGHNILACLMIGVLFGLLDYRFDLVTRAARRIRGLVRLAVPDEAMRIRQEFHGARQAFGCWSRQLPR